MLEETTSVTCLGGLSDPPSSMPRLGILKSLKLNPMYFADMSHVRSTDLERSVT